MLKVKYLPIRVKLSLIIMTTVFLAVFLLSSVFIVYEYVTQKQNIINEYSTTSKIIADQSEAALMFMDISGLQENLGSLQFNNDVVAACLYDDTFELKASFVKAPLGSACPVEPIVNQDEFTSEFYYRSEPVMVDEEFKGLLFIQVSLARRQDLLSTYVVTMFVITVIICFVVYLLSAFLQRFISSPLLLLKHTASQISTTQDYSLRATKVSADEIGDLVDTFNSMLDTIKQQNDQIIENAEQLEHKVSTRTAELAIANDELAVSNKELAVANKELEAFSYSVSHDLRAPLRAIDGFSKALAEDFGEQLDETAHNYLNRVRSAAQKMGELISSLLILSRVTRKEIEPSLVDLSALALKISQQLQESDPDRQVAVHIQAGMTATADPQLIEIALDNLISNAWKYTSYESKPVIDIGCTYHQDTTIYFVKDNGAGFDKQYAKDLFTAFKRLHSAEQFAGTGIGLATVSRIVHRHHGDIWANSVLAEGAQFYFTLNASRPVEMENVVYADSCDYHRIGAEANKLN